MLSIILSAIYRQFLKDTLPGMKLGARRRFPKDLPAARRGVVEAPTISPHLVGLQPK